MTRKKTKETKLTSKQLKSQIHKLFKRHPKKLFNPKQVIQKLKVVNNKDSVQYALEKLVEDGKIVTTDQFKYKLQARGKGGTGSTFHVGILDMTRSGSAYVVCDDLENDVHVSAKFVNTALNGDKVRIRAWTPRGRRRAEGEVIEILERTRDHFLGTIWMYPKHAIVVPDGITALDIVVDHDDMKGANDQEKVVVKIVDWQDKQYKGIRGVVTTVLGQAGSNDIEMKTILINNGFQLDFPDKVMEESRALPETISEEEISKRRDFRPITTFTIDPDTAKDFDDALSIEYLDNGNCEVGVHIADVTHYVKEGTALDKEALDRSTSVYLVDRVLPMLPEKLSNELCSLRPHEDKLTFSASFVFDKSGNIVDRWFGKAIIHSDHRFAYEEAQEVLEKGEGPFAKELKQLNKLAKILRKQKFKNGAINFETDEVKFRLDEAGKPIEIYVKERKDAHMLIEDFMLLANREVALYINKKANGDEIPFIYRVHDEPALDKVEEFARFAREIGFDMDISDAKTIAKSYNRLAEMAQSDPGLKLIMPLAIRTMAKAAYSSDNVGHYGLGFEFYSHFTSPIRRYSDVLAHRILEKNLVDSRVHRVSKSKLEEKCQHISLQERRAMEAERDSIKYKQVEFIENHIGEEFEGFIAGIIDRGIFVELEGSRIEGMVSFESMDEIFTIEPSKLKIKGFSSGEIFKIGDKIRVSIVSANRSAKQVEMAWVRK